jgi:CBS domain-containing protein
MGAESEAGAETMIVKNILPRALERLAVIEAGAPVREAAALMSKPHTDLIVVCDHGDMVGVLTKTDIVGQIGRCMGAGCTARVDSIMTRDVTYCRTHEILLDVWSVMRERGSATCSDPRRSTKAAWHHLCAGSLAGSAVRIRERG